MKSTIVLLPLLAGALAFSSCSHGASEGADSMMIVTGSYSQATEPGIKVYSFDLSTGQADSVSSLSGISNPSYLAIDDDASRIYSVGEDEGLTSTINAISLDKATGKMELLESIPAGGGAPCFIAISPDGSQVITANYFGGSISFAELDSLGKFKDKAQVEQFYGHGTDTLRQEQPHLHTVAFLPGGTKMLATDLGKDEIYVFGVEEGRPMMSPSDSVALRPGSGPRHIAFAPDGRFAYVINEISGYVTVLNIGADIEPVQYEVCDSLGAQGSGDIHLAPDGKHLYASNRLKGDGISIYDVDATNGTISKKAYQPTGRHPRNFAISPDGAYLLVACRDDDMIQVFARDPGTGLLTNLNRDILTPKPVCVKFVE